MDHGGIHNGPPWDQWDVQEWNKQLLRFCFVADADAPADQFLRAAEEDLLELTGDHKSEPRAMAEKLVEALKWQAERRNRKPADFVLKHQMKKYTPSALEVPPFFAFLWVTCLIAHGYPDPSQKGQFHARYEAVFGSRENPSLTRLPEAWEKLSDWLAMEGLFEGERHRKLMLPPTDDYRSNISHSWWLSFPRLADYRLLQQTLNQLQERHDWHLKANSPQLIQSLLGKMEFSSEFRDELKKLDEKPDTETGFSSFLDRVIQKTKSSRYFGPLVLCSYGDVLGVLLLADGVSQHERDGWHEEPGHAWCEKLNEHRLLVPNDAETEYAGFEGGSIAIDRKGGSPIAELHSLIRRGLLPFELDADLHCPRLLLSLRPSAEPKPSHVVVFEENSEIFIKQFGGKTMEFDCDGEGWVCIKDFNATAKQLKTFATSGTSLDNREVPSKLSTRGGIPVQGGFLARGLGLPSVRVQSGHPAESAKLYLPQEEHPVEYVRDDKEEMWKPPDDIRKRATFQPGEAKLVASFPNSCGCERTFQLKCISSHVKAEYSRTITYREDWGCKLGPIDLKTSEQSSDFELDNNSEDLAQDLLNNEGEVNPQFEQQMLDALFAIFQRRQCIKRRDFRLLYRQLGGMSCEWPLFYEGLLRAWCEGGWLEEGMDRKKQWSLQPIDPRLVQTSSMEAQVAGLLSVSGLKRLLAIAISLEMEVKPVAPACPRLPRGWRFRGEVDFLAEFSGLPLVAEEDWVELPLVSLDEDPPWVVLPKECDGPDWPRCARDHYFCEEQICGTRKGRHLDYSQPLEELFRYDDKASPSKAVIHREHGFGRVRWRSPDDGHGPFLSCHRNRAALHAIDCATNGFWPFGFPSRQKPLIERFYDADAYLPLPIGRFAALKGKQLPGPTLPPHPHQHTYSYWLDQETAARFREDANISFINIIFQDPHA